MYKQIKCPYSGEYFKPSRSNQKFASKRNRVAYYNQEYRQKRLPLERINQRLFYNYNILSDGLGDNSKAILNNHYLKGRSFDFKFITHLIKGDIDYFGLYDIAFRKLNNNQTEIIRNESIAII